MRRRTGLSYLFKMVSRTNIELNIVLIAIVLVFNIDFVCPSDVNKNLSTTPIPPNIHYTTELVNRNFSVQNSNDEIDDDTLSFSTDNELWDGLIKDCLRNPTFACFQKNVHSYLNSALDLDDVNVTSGFKFLKNKVDLYKYTKEANDHFTKENEIPDEEARSATPIEEVTDALSGKGVQFLMTHDIELNMPGMLFDSSILRISPRSFEGNGALVKVELIPNEARSIKATGRIFKKIKKFFRNKLLLSFLAIVLVIKLIKIKVLWILPLIFGVATAKKLILKFVLFLFPAFAHIFTLCSYYQKNYQDTKFHHHQHHISHLHTVVPPWYNEPHHDHHHDHHHGHGPELIYTSPPKGHPSEYLHGPSINTNYGHDWEASGPGLGSEYISDVHRIAQVHNFKPKVDDVNEINSWGLGTTMPSSASHSNNNNPLLKDTPIRTYKSDQIGQYNSPVYTPVKVAPKNAPVQYNTIQNDKMAHEAQRLQAQQKEAMRILAEQKLVAQQQKILQQQPFVQDTTSSVSAYVDPFYSPILAKIDKIFLQLNIIDEPCRERLVCNMYKNPAKYSPHSNFISAELSRDTSELRRPDSTNPAVIRFYRYVQAARDGQDQKDCQEFFKLCQIRME